MNSKNQLVSLCLFSYNQQDYIEKAIKGALSQTYEPLEIIISDDCSTDDTFKIVTTYLAHYNGPHKIVLNRNTKNLGLAAHVNKLFYELSKGEFVAAAAGDDISLPERLSKSVEFLNSNKDVVALSTGYQVIDESGKETGKHSKTFSSNQIFDLKFYLSPNSFHINGPTRILRRNLIQAFPPLNDDCPTEDTTFLLRAFMFGKVALLKDNLIKYRVHNESITSAANVGKIDRSKIVKQYKRDIEFGQVGDMISKDEQSKLIRKIYKNEKRIQVRTYSVNKRKPILKLFLNKIFTND